MKAMKLDHIGIAVKNLDEVASFYEDVLGIKVHDTEVVEDQKVKVAFLPIGDTELELLESTHDDGPIARYIDKKGEGVQHLAFKVEDIDYSISYMMDKGYRMIDESPRYGAGGARIAFMHPKGTKGVLVELCERNDI